MNVEAMRDYLTLLEAINTSEAQWDENYFFQLEGISFVCGNFIVSLFISIVFSFNKFQIHIIFDNQNGGKK